MNLGSLLSVENTRRLELLRTACEAWKLERGVYPATLEELVGTYLSELPTVPYYGGAYQYQVTPDGEVRIWVE